MSPFKLGFRNFELDMHLVTVAQVNPLNQPGHDHMLGLRVGFVKAFGPGKQLVDLRFGFLCILGLCLELGSRRCQRLLCSIHS